MYRVGAAHRSIFSPEGVRIEELQRSDPSPMATGHDLGRCAAPRKYHHCSILEIGRCAAPVLPIGTYFVVKFSTLYIYSKGGYLYRFDVFWVLRGELISEF